MPYIKWFCNTMLLTANIKGSFIITFAMVYIYRLTSSVKYSMIINNFANRFLWGLTKTGSWALQEQLDLLTPNGLVWWRILFTILTVRFRALQELIDLLTFIGLKCWLTILALQRLSLLPIVKQTGLLTVDGLASLLILLALQTFLFTWITRKYSLNRSILIQTFYISTNNRQNKVTSRSDMVTTVYRFRSSLTNIVQ